MNSRTKYSLFISLGILALTLILMAFKSVKEATLLNSNMVLVKGGKYIAKSGNGQPTEINVKSFLIDKDLVTVAEFKAFVKATGYITEAETFGNSGVFDFERSSWDIKEGANYLFPFGKDKPEAQDNHPVTQVSWNDAVAYATWAGKRLPTQLEWEYAAELSNNKGQYSWGDNLIENNTYKANTWQGSFPYVNTGLDGFMATSPVGHFGVNGLGLTDMGGNVWQWCADEVEPTERERQIDPSKRRVLKGGSFLCDPNVCHGYQIKGKSASTPESGMVHIGFRCVKNVS